MSSFRWLRFGLAFSLVAGLVGCSQQSEDQPMSDTSGSNPEETYAAVIRQPPIPKGVIAKTAEGQLVEVSCNSCHSIRPANESNATTGNLDEFHQGLQVQHGNLTCVSCHSAEDGYESLRLASGRRIPFGESMTLCGQCHGTQLRDYQHGAHGGMTGYWDRSRGGQERNHCLHCHDAHHPRYPSFNPAAPPRDRFPPVGKGEHDG